MHQIFTSIQNNSSWRRTEGWMNSYSTTKDRETTWKKAGETETRRQREYWPQQPPVGGISLRNPWAESPALTEENCGVRRNQTLSEGSQFTELEHPPNDTGDGTLCGIGHHGKNHCLHTLMCGWEQGSGHLTSLPHQPTPAPDVLWGGPHTCLYVPAQHPTVPPKQLQCGTYKDSLSCTSVVCPPTRKMKKNKAGGIKCHDFNLY